MSSSSLIDADFEQARLAVLYSYAIVDTPPEQEFDEIVRLAARECQAPLATLSLVDAHRCWFKARVGFEATELSRDVSFCHYAIRNTGLLLVPDATLDPRFNQLPVVKDAGFTFYAGTPIISPTGHPIGVLAVLDRGPRELSASQRTTLETLSKRAMDLISQRRSKTAVTAIPFAPGESGIGKRSLLIVDDDDAVRSFVCVATRRLGYEVLQASNGAEALRQLEEHPERIGLVLTDINMPVMDGLELVKALKKKAGAPPVAVMSGRFDPHVRAALRTHGVGAVINKPFTTEELKQALLRAVAPAV